jgi:hypothetical protein
MASNVNNQFGNGKSFNRLFLFEPNPANNGLIPNENLNIIVELETTKRGRSAILLDEQSDTSSIITVNKGSNKPIKFIGGTKFGEKRDKDGNLVDDRYLTTNYTEIGNKDFNQGGEDDLEALGIESINIDFDTAYTPRINIKFIDVRGHALFSKNTESKYSVFFSLPYPIFKLTVKGYFGRPVTYCLHLTKWNSRFNSDTGNFEIDSEFIGYTYAKLTDMLMGVIRANIYTQTGSQIWSKRKQELLDKGISIKSIDETFYAIHNLSEELEKIKNSNNADVNDLESISKLTEATAKLDLKISDLSERIVPDSDALNFINRQGVIGVPQSKEELTNDKIEEFKKYIDDNIETINSEIKNEKIKLDSEKLKDFRVLSLNSNDLTNPEELKVKIINNNSSKYNEGNIGNLSEIIINNFSVKQSDINLIVVDYRSVVNEVDNKNEELKKKQKDIRVTVGEQLAEIAKSKFGFEPTIRNLTRTLTTHCEVFMETLTKISKNSENNNERKKILNDLFNKDNKSLNVKNVEESIYPWPEYREKKVDSEDSESYKESWIGKKIEEDVGSSGKLDVNEVVYVEDLLKNLIRLAREDDEVFKEQTSSDKAGFEGQTLQTYYPISPIDTSIVNNILLKNPYIKSITESSAKGVPEEITRLMLYRGFLGLSDVINKNLEPNEVKYMGIFEAENLYDALINGDLDSKISRDLAQAISSDNTTSDSIIDLWKKGTNKVKNPFGSVKPLLVESGGNYFYNYIGLHDPSSIKSQLIPVNGDFDGSIFYEKTSDGKVRLKEDKLNDLSGKVYLTNTRNGDDGGLFFKIIDSNEYLSSAVETSYGLDTLEKYAETYAPAVDQGSIVNAYNSNDINIEFLSPYINRHKAAEIGKFIYNDTHELNNQYKAIEGTSISTVASAYWYQSDKPYENKMFGGTFLATTKNISELEREYGLETGLGEDYYLLDGIQYDSSAIVKNGSVGKEFGFTQHGTQRELIGALDIDQSITKNDIFVPNIGYTITNDYDDKYYNDFYFSLFGTKFYYSQTTSEAKSFLFLNTLSWQGICGKLNTEEVKIGEEEYKLDNIFNELRNLSEDSSPTIKSIFGTNSAFIYAPKLWCAFIGSVIYRYEKYKNESVELINFDELPFNYFDIKTSDRDKFLPRYDEYLHDYQNNADIGMYFQFDDSVTSVFRERKYLKISNVIKKLPRQVKDEFLDVFNNFTNNEFLELRNNLELTYNYNSTSWDTTLNNILDKRENSAITYYKDLGYGSAKTKAVKTLPKTSISDVFTETDSNGNAISNRLYKNYLNVSPYENSGAKQIFGYNLVIKPDSPANNILINMMRSTVFIMNSTPHIFRDDDTFEFKVKKVRMKTYLDSFLNRFKELSKNVSEEQKKKEDAIQRRIFNSNDDDLIKLTLYRHLSSVYNKWISNSEPNGNFFNECVACNQDSLIDTFKFIDRSYQDIGDKFYINPLYFEKIIRGKNNQSFFDVMNKMLSENNFNFIPLPTFINYTDIDEVIDVFRPYTYKKAQEECATGPSFICTYVGQTSTDLDLGTASEYDDDGIVLQVDSNLNILGPKEPVDFFEGVKDENNLNIPYFLVSYARQNQSYFKNIKLDQTEFTETLESLEIIDELSNKAPIYGGQNLWNVYQKRAYSAEVEMMGNPMIQPMMYFQLDDIPMFRGAYHIIKVSHTITPHNFQTKFKGTRIKKTKTPLIDSATLYISLLNSLETDNRKSKDDPSNNNNTSGSPSADYKILPTNEYFKDGDKGIIIEE